MRNRKVVDLLRFHYDQDCAAAEHARIVAMLRREAEIGPVGAAAACRYVADLLERGERAKPK